VNVVQALLSQDGDRLLGSLGYASQWADGTAVSCGWRPRPDLMVQMTHLRVPRHHRYREEWELVTEDARLRLHLPSPYAQEDNGELRTTRWDARGAETTTICRRDDAPPAFTAQLAAWARAIQGTAAPLPGLTDACADAAVVLEAARNLA
jgi:predicted dehydrogenase